MKKVKKYRVPPHKQPVFKVVKCILKPFWGAKNKKFHGEFPQKCIVLSNHLAKTGPMAMELNLPVRNVKWGAHEMLGNYKSRFLYLRDIFYIRKCKKSKFAATVKAAFEAIFSPLFYKGLKVMGTYQDTRFYITLKNSIKALDAGFAVTIFPEDSNDGYLEGELTRLFAGFVLLAQAYYKKTGEDLPVIPVYYHKKSKTILSDEPIYVNRLCSEGYSREVIAEKCKNAINSLCQKVVQQQQAA